MEPTPTTHNAPAIKAKAEKAGAPSPVAKLIDGTLDLGEDATSALDFAFDTLTILKRGVDRGSRRHIEAALVMLEYLANERLAKLARNAEKAAKAAEAAQRWPDG